MGLARTADSRALLKVDCEMSASFGRMRRLESTAVAHSAGDGVILELVSREISGREGESYKERSIVHWFLQMANVI